MRTSRTSFVTLKAPCIFVCKMALLWLFLMGAGLAWAAPVVWLEDEQASQDLLPYLEILEDPRGEYTIHQLLAHPDPDSLFKPMTRRQFNPGLNHSVWWLRLRMAQSGRSDYRANDPWLIHLAWADLSAQCYQIDADGTRHTSQAGLLNIQGLADPTWAPNRLKLWPVGQESATVFVRISSPTVCFLTMHLCRESQYAAREMLKQSGQSIYYGFFLAFILLNTFLFITLKDQSYFWYVVHLFFLWLYMALIYNPLLVRHLPFDPIWLKRLDIAVLGASMLGAVFFTRRFLLTPKLLPGVDKGLIALAIFCLAMVAFCLWAPVSFLVQCVSLLGLAVVTILIAVGIFSYRRAFEPARFFLLSWIFYFMGGCAWALCYRGWITLTVEGLIVFQVCSALGAVMLTFALAERIKTLRRDRDLAHKALNNALHRNELFSLMVENKLIGICIVQDDKMLWSNQRLAEVFEMSPEEMVGRPVRDFYQSQTEFETTHKLVMQKLEREGHCDLERMMACKGGKTVWCRMIGQPLDPAQPTGQTVWLTEDITARKRIQQELFEYVRYEEGMTDCLKTLISHEPVERVVPLALEAMLGASGLSRVYIFQNIEDPLLGLCMRQIYEVCRPHVQPQIDKVTIIPYTELKKDLHERLQGGLAVQMHVSQLTGIDREILEKQQIKSLILIPMFLSGQWWGFIGFDNCEQQQEFDERDVDLLSNGARMLSTYLEIKHADKEREKLIFELKQALAEIKTLHGLLPVCACCKKIRNDQGYWSQIEEYIQEHSQAEITHSICPECAQRLYPEIYKDRPPQG